MNQNIHFKVASGTKKALSITKKLLNWWQRT